MGYGLETGIEVVRPDAVGSSTDAGLEVRRDLETTRPGSLARWFPMTLSTSLTVTKRYKGQSSSKHLRDKQRYFDLFLLTDGPES